MWRGMQRRQRTFGLLVGSYATLSTAIVYIRRVQVPATSRYFEGRNMPSEGGNGEYIGTVLVDEGGVCTANGYFEETGEEKGEKGQLEVFVC